MADLVFEVHDTHHPVGVGLYYDDQRNEAIRRARDFVAHRMPKFLGWLEHVLVRNQARGSEWLVGDQLTYVDLSTFQLLEGLAYAFPRAFTRQALNVTGLIDLRARVAQRPRIAAYLTSPRRIPFNQQGIFRHYPSWTTTSPTTGAADEKPPSGDVRMRGGVSSQAGRVIQRPAVGQPVHVRVRLVPAEGGAQLFRGQRQPRRTAVLQLRPGELRAVLHLLTRRVARPQSR